MPLSTIDGDVTVRGVLRPTQLAVPSACVGDVNIDGSAPIGALKLQHQYSVVYRQANGADSVAEDRVVHVVYGATASLIAVRAGVRTACVAPSKLTVDVKKNGVSVLSVPFDITSANAAYALVSGSVAVASLVSGDVLEVVITATGGGTQGQGLFVQLVIREGAA